MIRRRTMLVAAMVLLPVSAVAGCAKESRTMTPQFDEDLDAKFAELRASGGSAPLRTLTSFDWDAVYCYYEGATASEVNGDVGAAVLEPGSRLMVSGALAVFTNGGGVVKALVIPELTFTPGRQPAGTTTVVDKGMTLASPN
ncbi:hypothetical protein ACQEVC_06695 [Plantactinospora sp. CA-294935]|uniref:hypothetical protein n=1 Tax=Plantactinospora sp. CA-294935 TaxID=3240012 RepID=UPI003D8EA8CF